MAWAINTGRRFCYSSSNVSSRTDHGSSSKIEACMDLFDRSGKWREDVAEDFGLWLTRSKKNGVKLREEGLQRNGCTTTTRPSRPVQPVNHGGTSAAATTVVYCNRVPLTHSEYFMWKCGELKTTDECVE